MDVYDVLGTGKDFIRNSIQNISTHYILYTKTDTSSLIDEHKLLHLSKEEENTFLFHIDITAHRIPEILFFANLSLLGNSGQSTALCRGGYEPCSRAQQRQFGSEGIEPCNPEPEH